MVALVYRLFNNFFNWICYTALNRRIVVDDEFSKESPRTV